MYRIREEKKRGTWTLPYGQTLKLIYLICTISYLHHWPSIARSAKSMILHPRESYILKQIVCLSVEVLKPRSLFKLSSRTRGPKNYSRPQSHTFTSLLTESRVPMAQKLFKTSVTHFYFFTYRIPIPKGPKTIQDLNHTFLLLYLSNPESRGPKIYSGPQSHTFTSLLTESRVPRAQKLFRTSITHFYFFTYRIPSPESPKIIQDLNHTLLLLYLPSPESWVSTNPGPKSQCPSFKLLTRVLTVKEPNGKKKPSTSRVAPRCVEPRE